MEQAQQAIYYVVIKKEQARLKNSNDIVV